VLRERLWPLLSGLACAPSGVGRGRSSPRPRARRPPRGTSCVLGGTVSPRLERLDVPRQRLSARCIGVSLCDPSLKKRATTPPSTQNDTVWVRLRRRSAILSAIVFHSCQAKIIYCCWGCGVVRQREALSKYLWSTVRLSIGRQAASH
jgi:hypothetical protein